MPSCNAENSVHYEINFKGKPQRVFPELVPAQKSLHCVRLKRVKKFHMGEVHTGVVRLYAWIVEKNLGRHRGNCYLVESPRSVTILPLMSARFAGGFFIALEPRN